MNVTLTGRLLVCATPIGNLGDVTLRVLDALREADSVAAEDTRVTRKLFARYEIDTPLFAYHAHNLEKRTPELVDRMASGEVIALVSDAGTPGVSDPGSHLVDACIDAGLPVDVLPGASAITTALVASGLPTFAFYFGGFLPRKEGERRRRLEALLRLDATLLFYESPRRVGSTLASIAEIMPARKAAMARELTKLHQEVERASVAELARSLADRELKGEVVLVIGPPVPEEQDELPDRELVRMVQERMAAGESRKDAVKSVSRVTKVSRNRVYEIALTADSHAAENPGQSTSS